MFNSLPFTILIFIKMIPFYTPRKKFLLFYTSKIGQKQTIDHRWILVAQGLQNFRIFFVAISTKSLETFSVYLDLAGTSFSLSVYFGDPNSKFPYRLVYCKRKKGIPLGGASPYSPP